MQNNKLFSLKGNIFKYMNTNMLPRFICQKKDQNNKPNRLFSSGFNFTKIFIFILLIMKMNCEEKYSYNYYELKNGLKWTILERKDKTDSRDYISISIKNGHMNDDKFTGASHILEHLIFRSNFIDINGKIIKIEKNEKIENSKKINFDNIITKNHGYNNAFTEYEFTTFHCYFHQDAFEEIFYIYLKYILDSDLNKEYYKEEINNVNDELNGNFLNDDEFFLNELYKKLLTENSKFKNDGLKIYNTKSLNTEEIQYFDEMYNHIKKLHKEYYKIDNISISVTTNKNASELQKKIIELTKEFTKNPQSVKNSENLKKNIGSDIKLNTENLKLNINSDIKKEYSKKLFFIENDNNINKLFFFFELDFNIYDNNYIEFIDLLLTERSNNSFYFQLLKNKKYIIDDIYYSVEYNNYHKTIIKIQFILKEDQLNNYDGIINTFYNYIEFLKKQDLKIIYDKFYEITKNNKDKDFNNNIWINNYINNEDDMTIILSKFNFFNKNGINGIKNYGQIWSQKFDEKKFKDILDKGFNKENAIIIYTVSKDNSKNISIKGKLNKKSEYESNGENHYYTIYDQSFDKTNNQFELYQELLKINLENNQNKKNFFSNYKIDKGENTQNKNDLFSNNYKFIKIDEEKNIPLFYKKCSRYRNSYINLKIEIFSEKLIKGLTKDEKFILRIFKLYLSSYFDFYYRLKKIIGTTYNISYNNYHIQHSFNGYLSDIIDLLNFILNIEENFDEVIFNLVKDELRNTLYQNESNEEYSNFIFSKEFENNYNFLDIYKDNDFDEEYLDYITNFTKESFINFINEIYKNKKIYLYFIGDVSEESIKIFKNNFNNKYNSDYIFELNEFIKNKSPEIEKSFNEEGKKIIKDNLRLLNDNEADIVEKEIENNYLNINKAKVITEKIVSKKIKRFNGIKDNNKIYFNKKYFKIKHFKDYLIAWIVENNIYNTLYEILRNKLKVGYTILFNFKYTKIFSNFNIIIAGEKYNSDKHIKAIYYCYDEVINYFNKMDDEKIEELFKKKYDMLNIYPKKFESYVFKINLYNNFKNIDMPKISKTDIKEFIDNNIKNNYKYNTVVMEDFN